MTYRVTISAQAEADLRGLRRMPVDNYLVYYIPDKDTWTVHVIRVLYGGMDVKRELESNK